MNCDHYRRCLTTQERKPDTCLSGDRSIAETLHAIETLMRRNLHRLHLLPLPAPKPKPIDPRLPRPLAKAGFKNADEVRLAALRMQRRTAKRRH